MDESHVLVVDDDRSLADLYSYWLEEHYRVTTVYDGDAAIQVIREDDLHVVLLDRRMPSTSGDEVLDFVREHQVDARAAMVTAVAPDFDILELGFDAYLVKPVDKETLVETIERLLRRSQYSALVQDYFSGSSKRAALESAKSRSELAANDEYQALMTEIGQIEQEVSETLAEMEDEDFQALFYQM